MQRTLEAIEADLFAKDGASSPFISLQEADVAAAWERCEDGRVLLRVAIVSGERMRAVKATMTCVVGASTYERLYCGPFPIVEEAIRQAESWLDDPSIDRNESLKPNVSEIGHWVKWTSGSACARAIADVVELTHAVANAKLLHAPSLAANALANAADAMVDDALRDDGASDTTAAEARLRVRALAYLTQVVRELVPCPAIDARELHRRWLASWGATSE
jgi:hypothetical protein